MSALWNHSIRKMALNIAAAAVLSTGISMQAQSPQAFPTAQAAVDAMVQALRSNDAGTLHTLLGADARDILNSGDTVQDKADIEAFLSAYDTRHHLVDGPDGTKIVDIGESDWPAPIPLRKGAEGWYFDTATGKQVLLYRRVGRNEITAMEVCRQLVQLEHEYARGEHDGNPAGAYAARFWSRPGLHDGLYWETTNDESPSPAGPLLAYASAQGYGPVHAGDVKPEPYGGYYFKILTAQGPNAPGGAHNYFVNGALTRGFAILAFPAEYKVSGVMTFMADAHGRIYQKDLGNETATVAQGITAFDPDRSWTLVSTQMIPQKNGGMQ